MKKIPPSRIFQMWIKSILSVILAVLSLSSSASVTFENLVYNIDQATQTASVAKQNGFYRDLTLPESITYQDVEYVVTSIEAGAFSNSGKTGRVSGTLTLPAKLKVIGESAFYKCGITSVHFPDSLISIGDKAFIYCDSWAETLSLPESVETIGNQAFYSCEGLSGDLILPSSLLSIGASAFEGCANLSGRLELKNSLRSIGTEAFYLCKGLSGELILPDSLQSIGESAFASSNFTGSLRIPELVRTIPSYAFQNCTGFTDVIFPDSLETIQSGAFSNCTNITGPIIFGEGLTSFAGFGGCTAITEIVFKSGPIIRNGCLAGCESLRKITFLKGCKFTGGLGTCKNLTDIYINSYCPPETPVDVTMGLSGITVHVPKGAENIYKNYGSSVNIGYKHIYVACWGGCNIVEDLDINAITPPDTSIKPNFVNVTIEMPEGTQYIHEHASVGKPYVATFKPNIGWSINTLLHDGYDVTDAVTNNTYTIPDLEHDTTLTLSLEKNNIATGTEYPTAPSNIKVYTINRTLYIENCPENADIKVYNLGGKLIQQSKEHVISLPMSGVYIVNIEQYTFKIEAH